VTRVANVGSWLRRIVGSLSGILLLALLAGFTYEQIGRARDGRSLPPRVGRAIDIGGRTLNLFCSGEGSPAVILEAGGNAPGFAWVAVQAKISEFTRTCWYDRAGVGWSDPPPSPRTGRSVASDLHELLRRGGVPPRYVLVGASVGGEYVRIYTARYPSEVAGLVLVDSTHPDQHEPPYALSKFNRLSPGVRHLICMMVPIMSRFGVLRFIAGRMAQRGTLARLEAQPKALKTDADQACAATDAGRIVPTAGGGNPDLDNAARNAGPVGDCPLVVLAAGKYWAPDGLEKEAQEYHEVWVHQLQSSLAKLSTRGREIIVDAHHGIAGEAPEAVVSAVRQVVEEARAKK
jgi:pimeloyl-ACP methyl ester carboxylesterase